jgi:D-arabinose 1-dehydrogenase-like Zn-dependent alcohol dehydrogenase
MGSRQELISATKFLSEKKIVPIVCSVVNGLDRAEEGFDLIASGSQFGKIVISIGNPSSRL